MSPSQRNAILSRTALIVVLCLVVTDIATADGLLFVHTDHAGTPVAYTNAAGQVVGREYVTPYGESLNIPTGNDQPAYTGHMRDGSTNLVYMQARYYDPVVGRMLSPDPVGFAAVGRDHFGRYHYSNGNPVNFVDPNGLWVTWIHRRITYNAATKAGYTAAEAKALANAVAGVDTGTQSANSSDANLHYMAGKLLTGDYQAASQAIAESELLIGDTERSLKYRIHALQDKFAPLHGGRPWMPFWEAPDLASAIAAVFGNLIHFVSDMFISSELENGLVDATADLIEGSNGSGSNGSPGSGGGGGGRIPVTEQGCLDIKRCRIDGVEPEHHVDPLGRLN